MHPVAFCVDVCNLLQCMPLSGDIVDYLAGMLHDSGLEDVEDSIGPFLEGYGCDEDLVKACGDAVLKCANGGGDGGDGNGGHATNGSGDGDGAPQGAVKLKQGIVSMSSALTDQSEAEIDATRYMWGQDK